jgi:hypothetical protein
MNDIYSFYQLISKYQIEIPIIQRDYAQGRDNTKAADVRKSLVEKMKIAVEDEDKSLFFDFVYGRIDGNKFIPFDGQQRLTSLFLFHKYVFEKCQSESNCRHNGNCICKEILKRFSYATRQSSRDFCEKLVQENVIPSDDKKVSDNIKNLSWFYPDWQKDPTIIGMLTMLDEIHNQMNGKKNVKVIAEKLTSGCNCPITFHFVDMGEHKLSDETYVKMNARGKQLTPFENFKASLEQYLDKKNEQKLLRRLKGKYDESKQKYTGIDGTWLDLFWEVANKDKQVNEGKDLPDSLMMSFFNRHFMNVWRCWYANNSKSRNNEELDAFNSRIQKEMPLYPTKDDFVSFEIYSYVMDNCDVNNCLKPMFNLCDTLCTESYNIENYCQAVWNRNNNGSTWNLYLGDKNNNNRETYPSRVAYYALMKYFATDTDTDIDSLNQWMRVVWNIIDNSTIDSPDTYQSALSLIDKLSKKCYNIYDALANHFDDFQLGSQYHAKDQVEEEISKAKQILNEDCKSCKKYGKNENQSWEEIITGAERYAFFNGAIRFLFTDGDGNINWCDFDQKWTNAQMYFNKDGIQNYYQEDAKFLRHYISKFDKWEQFYGIDFDYKAETWKKLLLSTRFIANNYLLTHDITNQIVSSDLLKQYNSSMDTDRKKIASAIDCLINTSILVEASNHHSCLNTRYSVYSLYPNKTKTQRKVYVIEGKRNQLLSELCNCNKVYDTDKRRFESGSSNNFFWGWDINFSYEQKNFRWYRNNYIYLMGDLNPEEWMIRDESKKYDLDKFICFDSSECANTEEILKGLNQLIDEYTTKTTA